MITDNSISRILEAQMETWSSRSKSQKIEKSGPVIAITRQPGCGGELIAQTLAKEMGLVLYDCEIVEQIAKDANVSKKVIETLSTQVRSELDDWLAGYAGASNLSSFAYTQCLRRVLFTIAAHGSAVILGRGANFLIPAEKKTLGLYFVAPLEIRTANIMQADGLDREAALNQVISMEKAQRQWVKRNGHADVDDVAQYHMVINTALVKVDKIIQITKDLIKEDIRESSCNAD